MKNNYKWMVASLALLFSTGAANAQTIDDAVRFSQNIYEGTARFQAMGGAFAALGGDFSSLSINPAGIGVYRNFEWTFTPTVTITSTEASYLGNTAKDSRGRFGFGNMGFVGVYNTGQSKGLVSFNYGVGYNKLANFTGRFSGQGRSTSASPATVLGYIAEDAGDVSPDILQDQYSVPSLAYNTYLIDVMSGPPYEYIGATEDHDALGYFQMGALNHNYYRDVVGNVGEYVFTVGGNVSDKFYFGMTLGLQGIFYSQYESYSETAVDPTDFATSGFHAFTQQTQIDVSGAGVNLKFGAIYRPFAGLRLGAYIHTPTWMWLTDESFYKINSEVETLDDGRFFGDEYTNVYDYRINAPFKWGVGAAYTFGKVALLSVDYEGVDYSMIRMYGRDYRNEFAEDNEKMRDDLSYTSNIRVGAEVRLGEVSVRGGYAFYQSPDKEFYYDQNIISAGLGYANKGGFFIDGTYSFNPSYKYNYALYGANSQRIETDTFISKIILTLGFRF